MPVPAPETAARPRNPPFTVPSAHGAVSTFPQRLSPHPPRAPASPRSLSSSPPPCRRRGRGCASSAVLWTHHPPVPPTIRGIKKPQAVRLRRGAYESGAVLTEKRSRSVAAMPGMPRLRQRERCCRCPPRVDTAEWIQYGHFLETSSACRRHHPPAGPGEPRGRAPPRAGVSLLSGVPAAFTVRRGVGPADSGRASPAGPHGPCRGSGSEHMAPVAVAGEGGCERPQNGALCQRKGQEHPL